MPLGFSESPFSWERSEMRGGAALCVCEVVCPGQRLRRQSSHFLSPERLS
jgi:hypothetical protein